MSDFTVTYPRPDDVDRYRDALGLAREAIVRDIIRMVSIGQMAHTGELNDEWVLAGSMGLRLRGSTRFTMMDTDTSRGGLPDDNALSRALTLDDDDLVITPASPEQWKSSRKLIKAQPVDYQAFFASVGEPVTDSFTFTVSWRGLFEAPERMALTHPYPELIMPEVAVPVMDLTEQTAEKIVGWCAHGLIKHYVDVAWIFEHLEDEVVAERLGSLTERKLEIGRELFPDAYAEYPDLSSLFKPLYDPDSLVPPLGAEGATGVAQIRFAGAAISKQEAIQVVRSKALPALYGKAGPTANRP